MKRFFSLFFCLLFPFWAFWGASAANDARRDEPLLPFTDTDPAAWYYEAVSYVYENDLFHGVSPDRFRPDGTMTRSMFVTVLANRSALSEEAFDIQHFIDVPLAKWYGKSVEWAASYGLVTGVGKFQFRPEGQVTREQIAAILYRYAQAAGNDISVTSGGGGRFEDYSKISSYAKTAMDWAIEKGIINGVTPTRLNPKGAATRAQTAQIFYNARTVLQKKEMIGEKVSLPVPSKIDHMLYSMTLEEKVGQLFLPRFPDASVNTVTKQYHPAGYTLYEKDFSGKTKAQVTDMLRSCQQVSEVPLFLAVDEEGGSVIRVSSNVNLAPEPFRSPQKIYQASGIEGIRTDTRKKADLLLSLGLNLNLAPVCDVSTDSEDYIYDRTLGVSAKETAKVIGETVAVMEEKGLSGTLKHFPGYGNNLNTHTGISVDPRPYEQFLTNDFLPFQAGIEAGAPGVLVSHNIVLSMDPQKPASLSKKVHDILRRELGFTGVIMTDDLSMSAIQEYTPNSSPAVSAFLAGNDLLLTSDIEGDYRALLSAVKQNQVSLEQIESSVRRILEWKEEKGLFKD